MANERLVVVRPLFVGIFIVYAQARHVIKALVARLTHVTVGLVHAHVFPQILLPRKLSPTTLTPKALVFQVLLSVMFIEFLRISKGSLAYLADLAALELIAVYAHVSLVGQFIGESAAALSTCRVGLLLVNILMQNELTLCGEGLVALATLVLR